jgi:hypothetical protein
MANRSRSKLCARSGCGQRFSNPTGRTAHNKRFCSQFCQTLDWRSKNPDWKSRHRANPGRHRKICPECNGSFRSHRSDAVCCSDKCKNKRSHRLHPRPIRASRLRYYRRNRQKEIARMRSWRTEKATKAQRLENVEGLRLTTGLCVTLIAHAELAGMAPVQRARYVYSRSADAFNVAKALIRRFDSLIEIEKSRIIKLPDDLRKSEMESIKARLSRESEKPKKYAPR